MLCEVIYNSHQAYNSTASLYPTLFTPMIYNSPVHYILCIAFHVDQCLPSDCWCCTTFYGKRYPPFTVQHL
uniref:Uncharacterized protein n=1 Tax=Pararge aegeria TaxID=116150 RepID=S4PYA2_9NEOP